MNINIDKIKLELPSRLDDLCQISFNFDNLMKVLEYFFNNNVIMVKEIKDLRSRISDLEILHTEIDNLKLKTSSIEKVNDNINRSFSDMKERFFKSEAKVIEIDKKNQEFQKILEKNTKTMEGHEINLNNLNKVVEENIKTIKQINENIGINSEKMSKYEKEINEIHLENIKTHELIEKNNNKVILDQTNNEKQIESLNRNISEINENIGAVKNTFDKKYGDFDNCINNIMDTLKALSFKGISNQQNDTNNNLFKLTMDDIEREREKFKTFVEENKIIQDKKDKEQETIKKIIDDIKTDIDNINNKINNIEIPKPVVVEDGNTEKQLKDLENKFITGESLDKLNEYIKKITKTISALPNREEFETLNRNLLSRIKKLELDSNNGLLAFEAKNNKNIISNRPERKSETNVNYANNFAEKIKISILSDIPDIFKDLIKKEGKNMDISKNPQIMEIAKMVNQHNDEINNNSKTIIDLRRTIFAIEAEKKLNMLIEKTTKLEDDTERNKKKIFELVRTIEGFEDMDDGDDNYQPETIKGKLNLIEKSYNSFNDKFVQIEEKYKSLTKEIKEDIKSNLKIETLKTVTQFREKLEIFTRRFEEELRSKIDQMGLNNFEKKMNTKIYYDLKEKLNRNEMQKNNNAINRKIDSLENKISKTLVDTIIDLQMDEAPLIIKKTPNNMDICASCNQLIQRDRGYTTNISNTEQNNQPSQNINKNLSNSNNKFRKTFYGFNRTQTSMPKINNVMSLKKELPDINKYY